MLLKEIPSETAKAIYRARNGEVIEGKYVRISGVYVQLLDPSSNPNDLVEITPVFSTIFRNMEDGRLYELGRAMDLDIEHSSQGKAMFQHPFDGYGPGETCFVNDVMDSQMRAAEFYKVNVPN